MLRMPFSTTLFDYEHLTSSFLDARGVPVSKRPLAIVLHGKGDSLEAYQAIDQELGLNEFDFLLLNAPMRFGNGFKWIHDEPRHARSLALIRDLLFALVEELTIAGYSTENILWLGHSQGGRVAADLLLHSSERFLGFVGISTYVEFFPGWREQSAAPGAWATPWLLTHGTEDLIIRLREIRADVRELNRGQIPLTYREFNKGHDFDYSREVPYVREWIRGQLLQQRQAIKMPSRPIEKFGSTLSASRGRGPAAETN